MGTLCIKPFCEAYTVITDRDSTFVLGVGNNFRVLKLFVYLSKIISIGFKVKIRRFKLYFLKDIFMFGILEIFNALIT